MLMDTVYVGHVEVVEDASNGVAGIAVMNRKTKAKAQG
jgi:hypothetical protein